MFSKYSLKKIRIIGEKIESQIGSPIILIGMHRSGTSLVTRMLRQVGGYFGDALEKNSEPQAFIAINDAILDSLGVKWNNPTPGIYDDIENNSALICELLLSNIQVLRDGFFESYGKRGKENPCAPRFKINREKAGMINMFLQRNQLLPNHDCSNGIPFWGWKDPRNTITLNIWLKMFPHAKVINVKRNGIDSALSLNARAKKSGAGMPMCGDVLYCFNLWEKYNELCDMHSSRCNNYYSLRYEDLMDDPKSEISNLMQFLNIPLDSSNLNTLIKMSDSRPLPIEKWVKHPELVNIARHSRLFEKYGYRQYV